jgi:hypothetical protein
MATFACAALFAILAAPAFGANDQLSDAAVLQYASKPYDKRAMMHKHEVVGDHNGVLLIADFPCSDVCPDYTVRVIHYDVVTKDDCGRADGVWKPFRVPEGIGEHDRDFCFPEILAKHWERYVK